MTSLRQQRVADLLRTSLSNLLLFEVNDPRLSGITITEVQIDRELEYASIFVNALGEDHRQDEVVEALERATGFFRHKLSKSLDLRKTPQLRFAWDTAFEQAERIDDLLKGLDLPDADDTEDADGLD